MSATLDFLEGCAGLLVAASVGVYRPDGPAYIAAEVAITLTNMPDDPDQVITLTAYLPGGDDPNLPMGRMVLQARTRGTTDPRTEFAIRDAVYAVFQGTKHVQFGSVHLIQMVNLSSVPMGRDLSGRQEFANNFMADIDMAPTTNRSLSF